MKVILNILAPLFLLGLIIGGFFYLSSVQNEYRTKNPEYPSQFRNALAQGRNTGKPVIVTFGADWCGPCRRLENKTYRSRAVAKYKKHFIWVKLNVDHNANLKLAEDMGVYGIPRVVIFSGDGAILEDFSGSRSPAQMAAILKGLR